MTKNDYLEALEYLINKSKEKPWVYLVSLVNAKNEDIEDEIAKHVKYESYSNDVELTNDEYEELVKQRIKLFRNSKRYNPNGYSDRLCNRLITVDNLSFEIVRDTAENPPIGEFVKFIFDDSELMEDEQDLKNLFK